MGISVEVCVQDCIFEASENNTLVGSDSLESLPVTCPIAETVWSDWFQHWFEVMQPELSPIQAYELSLRLTGDREIQTLNAQYRHQDKPTDVLAFAALEDSSPPMNAVYTSQPLYLGDIIISVETAQRQANIQSHSLRVELSWLATHGLLHLLGWDHPDEESLNQMLAKQEFLLNTVGLLSENR